MSVVQSYNGINGFALKPPSQYKTNNNIFKFIKRREHIANNEEFVEITKERNKLPTVTLRTYVLYYRNNGDLMTSTAPGVDANVATNENYRFYNNYDPGGGDDATGRQLGWIWGFPLFDVGREKVSGDVSGNWPRWGSCIGNTAGFSGTASKGNETMLVDISDKQNIIVLDMSKFQFMDGVNKKGDGFDDIKNNIPGQTDNFYMTLRITGSSENSIEFKGTEGKVYKDGLKSNGDNPLDIGKNGNWPPFPKLDSGHNNNPLYDIYGRYSNKWCTLVEYEFYCDLINPKPFLDFTPNYFSFDFSYTTGNPPTTVNGRRFIQNEKGEEYITNIFDQGGGKTENNYTEKITLKITTGLGLKGTNNSMDKTMSPGNIIKGLGLSTDMNPSGYSNGGASPLRLKEKSAWNEASWYQNGAYRKSWTVAKIIGGWYSRGDSNDTNAIDVGYYGTIQNPGAPRQTAIVETEYWKNTAELYNTGANNNWDGGGQPEYNLNNILWCSLRSPRKIKVNYIGDNSVPGATQALVDKFRFITNFIELDNAGNGSNEILGGGYARTSNELDLPRKSEKPYFSKYEYQSDISQINSNTVGISEYDIDNSIQYLDASRNNNGNTLSLNDIKYYKIQYKLLIPPASGKNYKITYTFGKINDCVTTFFRFEDMSGTPSPFPDGSNNHYAIRDSESIELKWDSGETDIKTIYITDIASGTNVVESNIVTTDISLAYTIYDENYDLSFNVFQLYFFSRNAIDETNIIRDELPYTIYTFDTTSSDDKIIDISYSPVGYVPYRYINYFKKPQSQPELLFFSSDFSEGPFITREERILYKPGKIFPKGTNINNRTNAVVIDPSNTDVFPTVNIDISGDVIFDLSFSVTPNQLSPEEAAKPDNQGQEIATFDQQLSNINQDIFSNAISQYTFGQGARGINGNPVDVLFDEPLQLMLKNYLIPDYWRLSNKLNIIRTTNDIINSNFDDYRYYNTWENQIKTSMIFDILSIVLKSQGNINDKRVTNILINTNRRARGTSEYSAITITGKLLNNKADDLVYDVQGALGVPPTDYLNLEPIIVLLKASFDGPFGTLGQNFIGNKATAEGGINVPYPAQPGILSNESKFVVSTVLLDTLRRGNNLDGSDLGGSDSAYNGIFNIYSEVPNKEDYGLLKQNNSFIGTIIGPSPLPVLLVDISSAVQILNPEYTAQFNMLNDENTTVTIDWSGFSFSKDPNWSLSESDIYWSVSRYNLSTGVSKSLLSNTQIKYDFLNDKYTFVDKSVVIFTKYRYTVSGIFKWTGITDYNITTSEIPFLNVPGFNTSDILICKYNRFPYGRFNTTSTNLKLYAPLRLTTSEGQLDQHNKKMGGPCQDPNNTGLNLFTRTSRISSSNNIYANTTNQVSKKQTYVILSKSRFRPFR